MPKIRVSRLVVAAGAVVGSAAITNMGHSWAVAQPRAVPAIGTQLARLAGSGSVPGDWFGASVAVSSTTAVVGAPAEPLQSSGVARVYVFTRTATGWHQQAELQSPDAVDPDWFGYPVAVSGNIVVVGAPAISVLPSGLGRAYLFAATGTGWHQTAELGPVSSTSNGDEFGYSVAISGTTIAVGAKGQESGSGRAYLLEA